MHTDTITIGRNAQLTIAIMRAVAARQVAAEAKKQRKNQIIRAIKRTLFLIPARSTRFQFKP
jgi:hypothetical protein